MKLFEVLNPMITELKDDISQYTDAAKIGFEFECLISTKKMGDPEVDDYHDEQIVFDNLEQHIGKGKALWKIEVDGSLRPPPQHVGTEIVTHPIPYKNVPKLLDYYLDLIKEYGQTNDSCGLHINVSIAGADDLDYFKMALFMGEEYVLKMFNRVDNKYTEKHLDQITQYAKTGFSGSEFDDFIGRMNMMMSRDKYSVFSTNKEGYVEFRAAGGEGYEKDKEKIMNAVNRFVYILALGADKNLRRKEYIKKAGRFAAKAAEQFKVKADDDFGGDIETVVNNLFGKLVGASHMRPDDFQWLIYAIYFKKVDLSANVKVALRKYARQENVDEDDFRDRVEQDSRFDEDKNWEPFIKYAINLLGLK